MVFFAACSKRTQRRGAGPFNFGPGIKAWGSSSSKSEKHDMGGIDVVVRFGGAVFVPGVVLQ